MTTIGHRMTGRGSFKLMATVAAALLAAMVAAAPRLQAAVDEREMRAREAFAVGHYQDALDLFAKLYAEKLHPNYLRNIGRCYQNLGDPDKAIASFREYLRKAKNVAPDEKQEVEGYIKEMQDLKQQRETAAKGTEPTSGGAAATTGVGSSTGAGPSSAVGLPLASNPNPSPPPDAAGAQLGGGAAGVEGAGNDRERPLYQRWWFWLIVGGVAAAGLGAAAALGAFTKTDDAQCPTGTRC